MVNWVFTLGSTFNSSGLSQSVKNSILNLFQVAGDIWSRYLGNSNASIEVAIQYEDLGDTTLAEAGPESSRNVGAGVFASGVTYEIRTGVDVNGSAFDAEVSLNSVSFDANEYFIDPDPLNRTAAIPFGQFDLLSIIIHELGHPLGFISFSAPNDSEFETFVSGSGSNRVFTGSNAVAVFGGNVPIDSDSSHFRQGLILPLSGLSPIMDPSFAPRSREYITQLETAVLADLGVDVPEPTSGSDTIYGYDLFDDVINLQSGNDFFDGVTGDDSVLGAAGNDTLLGSVGADTLSGGSGLDSLFGGSGSDFLKGDSDNDFLSGGDGNDSLEGGLGFDDLRAGSGNDFAAGGDGNDSVRGEAGDDSLRGNGGADTLFGADGADTLDGGADNDFVKGDGGADRLFGDTGNDRLEGGADNDYLVGEEGNDSVSGGAGDDTVSGNQDDDIVKGDAGADQLFGQSGNDRLEGGDGNDFIKGDQNDDTLLGDNGDDSLQGNAGDDNLLGGFGRDVVDGNDGSDTLRGQRDNDLVRGGADDDTLFGNDGADTLKGDDGNDFIKGDSGGDRLIGGAGIDSLEGGAGNDTFVFTRDGVNDFVTGITPGAGTEDRIELQGYGTAFDTFTEVMDAATQSGSRVIIDFGAGDTLTLLSTNKADLHEDDFIFG